MAKKQKKNLQKLLAKKRQLQQIGSTIPGAVTDTASTPSLPIEKALPELPAASHTRELRRTFISIVIIAAVLSAVIIFDHKNPQLQQLGNWLYTTLRLKA